VALLVAAPPVLVSQLADTCDGAGLCPPLASRDLFTLEIAAMWLPAFGAALLLLGVIFRLRGRDDVTKSGISGKT
jgi:hypothetical protein